VVALTVAMAAAAGLGWWLLDDSNHHAAAGAPVVHVNGTRLVGPDGNPVQLVGVNRSGTEFTCLGGHEIFQGPVDNAAISAMAAWHVRMVRIPLNEDCWLGINRIKPAVGGPAYQTAIAAYVKRLEAHNIAVDLDLHWSAPGTQLASGQQVMADADHSPLFWRQVATRFRGDPHVVFELYNEPHDIGWTCWLDGCTVPGKKGQPPWQVAGMQELVNAVRSTGARNVILVGGLGHAGDLSHWAQMAPRDPDGQLAAAWHVYSGGGCHMSSCWRAAVSEVGDSPVLVTEFGESDCGSTFVDPLMSWLDSQHLGYLAWTWNDWAGCGGPSLLTSYDGQPRAAYGRAVRDHLVQLP
jgi:endoglucanase